MKPTSDASDMTGSATVPTPSPAVRSADPLGVATPSTSTALVPIAWVTTLLISRLPEIVLREIFGVSVPWMAWAVVALSVALWFASRLVLVLRPLERYFAVMSALAGLLAIIPIIFQSSAWQSISPPTGHPIVILLAERFLLALLAIVMIGIVLLLGTRPRDAYLTPGDIRAPTTSRKPGSGELLRWSLFGPIMFVFLLLITAWAAAPLLRAGFDVPAALPFLGLAAIAALLNAFWEEVAYRAAPYPNSSAPSHQARVY